MPAPSFTWVIPQQKKSLIVGVADMLASNDTSAELVTHSLGSCLGVTIYDPVNKVGGLLHLMLPTSTIDPAKAQASPYMFVDTGVPRLFHTVYGLGGQRQRLQVKVAGGAQFLDDGRLFNIGERNIRAFGELLGHHGLQAHASDVGGNASRTLRMQLATGTVSIHSPGVPPYNL